MERRGHGFEPESDPTPTEPIDSSGELRKRIFRIAQVAGAAITITLIGLVINQLKEGDSENAANTSIEAAVVGTISATIYGTGRFIEKRGNTHSES